MKNSIYTSIILCISILLTSCSDNEPSTVVPGAVANFTINIRLNDYHLNSAGNMGAYFSSTNIGQNEFNQYKESAKEAKSLQTYRKNPLAGEFYGVGGVLIINKGSSATSHDLGAYDLACPNEGQKNTRIIPDNDNRAKCPKCGSEFELFTGKTISGPALKKAKTLQYYFVRKIDQDEYRIIY